MAGFANGLREGIDEAAREMAEAQLVGDNYGAGAWRERLSYLRRVARRYGVELAPGRGPGGEACATTAAPAPDSGARAGRPAGSIREESG